MATISDVDKLALNEFFKQIAQAGAVRFPLPTIKFGDILQAVANGTEPGPITLTGAGSATLKLASAFIPLVIEAGAGTPAQAIWSINRSGVQKWASYAYGADAALALVVDPNAVEAIKYFPSDKSTLFAGPIQGATLAALGVNGVTNSDVTLLGVTGSSTSRIQWKRDGTSKWTLYSYSNDATFELYNESLGAPELQVSLATGETVFPHAAGVKVVGALTPGSATSGAKAIAWIGRGTYIIDFAAFSAGVNQTSAQVLTGVQFGDTLTVSTSVDLSATIGQISAQVTSAGNIKIIVSPISATDTGNPGSATFTVTAIRSA